MNVKKSLPTSNVSILLVFASLWIFSLLYLSTKIGNSHNDPMPISVADTTEGRANQPYPFRHQHDRRVTTVFSTACSASQDWMSQVLLYNHYQMGIPGDLVRLMACKEKNYQLPKHTIHPNYRVVWTPDFDLDDIQKGHTPYSPRNRPASMEYWLSGRSDDPHYPRGHHHIVLAIDPDQVFLTGQLDLSRVQPKQAIAAEYDIGTNFLNKWGHVCEHHNDTRTSGERSLLDQLEKNMTKCHLWQEQQGNPSFGHPQAMTATDALEHARVWYHMTNEIKAHGHAGWETEMFSNVFAALLVGIHFDVRRFMISYHDARTEPWNDVKGISPLLRPTTMASLPMWIGHYCQHYTVGTFLWHKRKDTHYNIHSCDHDPREDFVNSPTPDQYQQMEKARNYRKPGANTKMDNNEEKEFRHVWLLDHTWTKVREALVAHYEAFCIGN